MHAVLLVNISHAIVRIGVLPRTDASKAFITPVVGACQQSFPWMRYSTVFAPQTLLLQLERLEGDRILVVGVEDLSLLAFKNSTLFSLPRLTSWGSGGVLPPNLPRTP
ncbi:hypothetical protein VR010_10390 [Actinomycetaceae bacterium L2_0104]